MILVILALVALLVTLLLGYYTRNWLPFYITVAVCLALILWKGVQ